MAERNSGMPFDMPEVKAPVFGPGRFNVCDFDGHGDGKQMNTGCFRRAIGACAEAGGGTVVVPAGEWLTGAIHLQSNVCLHLAEGATLRFSTQAADYLPVVFTRWEGIECFNYSPFIYAKDAENIGLTGKGTLEGQGSEWWGWWKRQKEAAKSLYDAEAMGVPLEKRVYGTESAALRPQFFQPINCKNVLVEGVTFRDGPQWTVHPVYCENVLVRDIKVFSEGPNTDGLNPDSCRNVIIEDSLFSTGDDCIAINSGMNEDGWRVGKPCENIVVRNCTMEHGHGGVVIGSGMSGDVRNVYAHDCQFNGTDRGIRLKTMQGRGGVVENVWFENIRMKDIVYEAVWVDMFYGATTVKPVSEALPTFRDIHISGVSCDGAGIGILLRGVAESKIQKVVLKNMEMVGKEGLRCLEVDGLSIENVTIESATEPACSFGGVSKVQLKGVIANGKALTTVNQA